MTDPRSRRPLLVVGAILVAVLLAGGGYLLGARSDDDEPADLSGELDLPTGDQPDDETGDDDTGDAPGGTDPSAPLQLPFDGAAVFPPLAEPVVTLWVDAGADDGGAGTEDEPFTSINDALEVAEPGDVVGVRAGTYAEEVRSVRDGTADAPIRIVGFDATIESPNEDEPFEGRLVEIGHDHLTLEGFTLTGADKLVWLQETTGVRLLGNVLDGAGGECIRVKFQAVANEIAGNEIRNCGQTNFDLADDRKNGEGVYIGTAPEQTEEKNPTGDIDRSDRNWVHGNTFETPAECVDIKEGSSANLVEDNDCTGQLDPDGSGYDSRGNGNFFVGNRASDLVGAGVRLGGDADTDGLDNVVVDNVLERTEGYGLKIMRSRQGLMCGNTLRANVAGAYRDDEGEDDGSERSLPDPTRPCP